MKKQIILLSGPSSSGKSTLAPHLQKQMKDTFGQEYAIFSIDDYVTWPTDRLVDKREMFRASTLMYKEALKSLKSYDGVIIDQVITSERVFNQLTNIFSECTILPVQVTSPLYVLKERELARKDRYVGLAEESYSSLVPKCDYIVSVDTHYAKIEDCILRIIYDGLVQTDIFDY